ncbi:hypothetical protein [Methylorubrum zatmanii]|uniref:Uncharacterized protein n=1 Tax=Methylorubrum zatmanii TaxID=29429 RepID=A0ABW1WMP4_9HYPH|nr:hypothetical protein [Methylorubrum zatmanii]MBD8906463.1 hypothetical protein [Methylorubrum zatmanii]
MSIRIALAILAVTAASPALAQGFDAGPQARAPAPTLQGQKAWGFLTSPPVQNTRDLIVTDSISVRARETGQRPAK